MHFPDSAPIDIDSETKKILLRSRQATSRPSPDPSPVSSRRSSLEELTDLELQADKKEEEFAGFLDREVHLQEVDPKKFLQFGSEVWRWVMVDTLQKTFSNAVYWMIIIALWLAFLGGLFPTVLLAKCQQWLRKWLVAITWTNVDHLIYIPDTISQESRICKFPKLHVHIILNNAYWRTATINMYFRELYQHW